MEFLDINQKTIRNNPRHRLKIYSHNPLCSVIDIKNIENPITVKKAERIKLIFLYLISVYAQNKIYMEYKINIEIA